MNQILVLKNLALNEGSPSNVAAVKDIVIVDPNEEQKGVPKIDKKFECVFVKVGDKAKIRIIKTGIQDDTNIEVLTGLQKGDVVIIGPYSTVTKDLNSGDKVALKTENDKAKSKK